MASVCPLRSVSFSFGGFEWAAHYHAGSVGSPDFLIQIGRCDVWEVGVSPSGVWATDPRVVDPDLAADLASAARLALGI